MLVTGVASQDAIAVPDLQTKAEGAYLTPPLRLKYIQVPTSSN